MASDLISETEFARLCRGIAEDRAVIVRHNPIGSEPEILLWMLLNCLNSYLSLTEQETPCFAGRPDERTYREAIYHVLNNRRAADFDPGPYIDSLIKK